MVNLQEPTQIISALEIYLSSRKWFTRRGNKLVLSPWKFDRVVDVKSLSYGLNNAVFDLTIKFKRKIARKEYEYNQEDFIVRVFPDNDQALKPRNEAYHVEQLSKLPIPKARMYFYEDDPKYLGYRFFILEKLKGQPLTDKISELSTTETRDFLKDLAAILGDIHSIRVKKFDSYYLSKKIVKKMSFGHYIMREVKMSLNAFQKMKLDKEYNVDITYLEKWANGHRPLLELKEFSLIHGDLRPSNIIIDGSRISGLIDWEMCCFSDPGQDLGWTLFFFKLYENLKNERGYFFQEYWNHAQKFDFEARVSFYEFLAALKIFTYAKSNELYNPKKFEKNRDFFKRVYDIFPTYLDRVLYRD